MTSSTELHVVLGASGGAGNAVVRLLAAQGRPVRAVNRSGQGEMPAGVELVKGDVANPESARAVCQGASVVYNCLNVPYPEWFKHFPPLMAGAIEGAAAAGAKLVFADNLYMYGLPSGSMTEETPNQATTRKGQLRIELAETLLSAHRSGRVRAVIGRASDFYGPGIFKALAGEDVFRAVLAGKKAMWAGSLDAPHTLTFIDDFARGLVNLGERAEALGQIWHIPPAEPLTGRQFLQLAFEEAGLPPKIGVYKRPLMTVLGWFVPMIGEVVEVLYQFEEPFVMDGGKYQRAFGDLPPTPHREAIRQTLAWFRQHPK